MESLSAPVQVYLLVLTYLQEGEEDLSRRKQAQKLS
jgi:hypothetical protein